MMKKLFFLLLSVFALTTTAQAQKIALLEPRIGEGSTSVSGMEKAMVRGELRKAIVNHTGFEAFTRADIDQLMQEQDFQRTGNVSEADIHKMGEMSGADFICVSTLNKSDDEFYLEAYLINVETGAISNPASQYGELVNGKLANMLPICQALAQELLGTNTPIAQPVISQVTQQQSKQQSRNEPQQSNPSPTPTPAPKSSAKGIGELKVFPDGSKGIVFYMTQDGHGLVVSLDEAGLKWENVNNSRQCRDIPALPNAKSDPKYLTFQAGLENTNAIIQDLSESQAPAAAWCMRHGAGWYLPSAGELWYLFHEANEAGLPERAGLKGNDLWNARKEKVYNGPISAAMRNAGGMPFSDEEYWSSTESDNDDVFVVKARGTISQSEKPEVEMVRAVRAF